MKQTQLQFALTAEKLLCFRHVYAAFHQKYSKITHDY